MSGREVFHRVAFNQDQSCLACATSRGVLIFSLNPLTKAWEIDDGPRSLVQMLYFTSLVATVGAGSHPSLSTRRLQLFNTTERKAICELNFVSPILNVLMNKHRLVVVLLSKIHIFDIVTLKILYTIDCEPNPKGLCSLASGSEDTSYLSFPQSTQKGNVIIFDLMNLKTVADVHAHKGGLAAVSVNEEGSLLATASSKGTVIRLFSLPDGKLLRTFRRGASSARISCLAFNNASDLLVVGSDTETVHIFRIRKRTGDKKHAKMGGLMEMIDAERDFARIRVKTRSGAGPICAISSDDTKVFVVSTEDAQMIIYSLDPVRGGECACVEELSLLDFDS
eukprot:TRINITY_DN82799_c0_g1_i1.p1 TRINITY_DN82799_c0_g1~~TRINITY_DN82799_c0_g1_i1.p1  ORF type:complete len:337 (+),score=65.78 TRINITY_DN82799_c0_g1_i1:86-1096(+)